MKIKVLFVGVCLGFSSCGEGGSSKGARNFTNEEIIKVEWRGEDLGFTRLMNGKIPGEEVTQMWAESGDYKSNLSIRWGQNNERTAYRFDEAPDLSLRIDNNGEQLNYRPVESSVFDFYQEDDRVLRVEGSLELEPANSSAREFNDGEGGTLNFTLQKEKRKKRK
jgi:hypothetical protein